MNTQKDPQGKDITERKKQRIMTPQISETKYYLSKRVNTDLYIKQNIMKTQGIYFR